MTAETEVTQCNDDILLTVYRAGSHRFIWTYRQSQRNDVINSVGDLAAHPDVPFTWRDFLYVMLDVCQKCGCLNFSFGSDSSFAPESAPDG